MSVTKKVEAMIAPGKSIEEKLYLVLSEMDFARNGYNISELGNGIFAIEKVICGWWKQRYLIDRRNCRAYEIMDGNMNFANFTTDDIDWESLAPLPERAKRRAERLSAHYPTFVHSFSNGVAEVSWQLNPDGRYYMDDDGFGMSDDEEITVYGFIDSEMNVLVKFRYIGRNWARLKEMRSEAERILQER